MQNENDEPEILFEASSGNIAKTTTTTRGDKSHVSVLWVHKPSTEDAAEFDAAYVKLRNHVIDGSEIGSKALMEFRRDTYLERNKN